MSTAANIRTWHPVASLEDIPLKEGRRVRWQNQELALFNLGDTFLAVDNQCPHRQGPLADGLVSGKAVFCPLHNWKINLENGCALSGGTGQVKTFPVKVAGNEIYLAFEEAQLQTCEPSGPAPDIQAAKDMGG